MDAAFSTIGFDTPERYERFLKAQAGGVFHIELALEPFAQAFADLDIRWTSRAAAFGDDLYRLRALAEGIPGPLPVHGIEQALGMAYVLEGSRLGGRMLARQIRATPGMQDAPLAFLDHPSDAGFWQSFVDKLDAVPLDETHWPLVLEGAETAFRLFLNRANRQLA